MIKNICKKPFALLLVLLCVIVVLTVEPKKEMLTSSSSTGSGSGTTSGGSSWSGVGSSGQAGNLVGRVYGFNGMLNCSNTTLNPDYGRLHPNWKYTSPESHPHGDSEPEVSLMAPARGPFPYYLK